jgi:hypothetical protein
MSLHQKPTMSKSHRQDLADNQRTPIFVPGDLVSVYVGDRLVGGGEAVVPSGEAAYMEGVGFGQTLFAVLLRFLWKPLELKGIFGPARRLVDFCRRIDPESGR